jgi:hypothetical protein
MAIGFFVMMAALVLINLAATKMAGASCEPTTKADKQ